MAERAHPRHRLASFVASFLVVAGLIPFASPVMADNTTQTLPFSQDWSNTGLITTIDDWSGVPGINGYRGDALTAATGVDPQTVLADGSATPLDVHVNRMPVGGRVSRIEYRPGGYRAAYAEAAGVENERNEIWIDREGGPVVFRQITGVLVRRVVCRARVGDVVEAGDRFGVMKFGSRIDLFLPPSARLLVAPGDRVRAGETVIARLA